MTIPETSPLACYLCGTVLINISLTCSFILLISLRMVTSVASGICTETNAVAFPNGLMQFFYDICLLLQRVSEEERKHFLFN